MITVMLLIGGNRKRKREEILSGLNMYYKYYMLSENIIYSLQMNETMEDSVPFMLEDFSYLSGL
jgi:hypothetical protein